ncbi:MAG: hypothetical protein ABJG47_09475 [Ekhidna sp.]
MDTPKLRANSFLLLLPILLICGVSCQRSATTQAVEQEYQFLVLLASERSNLDDIEELGSDILIEKKRTSRSQNQWLVKVKMLPSEMDGFVEKLKQNTRIESIEAYQNN